jgi:hypothetical protein
METNQIPDDFSMARSGAFYKLLVKVGMGGSSRQALMKRSLILSMVAWLPLLMLTLLQDISIGKGFEMSFLKDFATHTRYLVIVPMLVFAETSVDFRLKIITAQFFKAGILNERDLQDFKKMQHGMMRLSDSGWGELIILFIVVLGIYIRWHGQVAESGSWVYIPGDSSVILSWAGKWFIFFSLPIFQFLVLRWVWRWIIWIIYFYRISRMPLKLNPAHPDLAGGIGFLGLPPSPFLQVNLALAFLFSTWIAERIISQHHHLQEYYFLIGGFALFSIVMNVLPLLVFTPPLIVQRRKGIYDYSALIQEHHRQFDEKWIHGTHTESLLGIGDASSTTDINCVFDTVMSMRVVPFNLKIMLSSIIISVLPMIPIFAFEYNLLDLVKKIAGIIL